MTKGTMRTHLIRLIIALRGDSCKFLFLTPMLSVDIRSLHAGVNVFML